MSSYVTLGIPLALTVGSPKICRSVDLTILTIPRGLKRTTVKGMALPKITTSMESLSTRKFEQSTLNEVFEVPVHVETRVNGCQND